MNMKLKLKLIVCRMDDDSRSSPKIWFCFHNISSTWKLMRFFSISISWENLSVSHSTHISPPYLRSKFLIPSWPRHNLWNFQKFPNMNFPWECLLLVFLESQGTRQQQTNDNSFFHYFKLSRIIRLDFHEIFSLRTLTPSAAENSNLWKCF